MSTSGPDSDSLHVPGLDDGELLREVAASTAVGLYLRSLDPPEMLYVNTGLRTMLGLGQSDSDLTVDQIVSAIHPEDLGVVLTATRGSGASETQRLEFRLRRADGVYRWVRVTTNPVPNEGQAAVRSVGMVEDVHDRHQIEIALADSEERFRQLAENVGVGFTLFEIEPEPEFSYANPAYKAILGLPRDAPVPSLASLLAGLVHPDDRLKAPAAAARVRQGLQVDEELRILRPDGELRWLRSRRNGIVDDSGRVVRVAGTTEDITARKDSELALRASEERFRQLADNVSVGFTLFGVDEPPEFVYANRAFFRIVGVDPDSPPEQLGRLIPDTVHPEDRPLLMRAIEEVKRGVEIDEEIRIIRPDGEVRWTRTRRSPVVDADGVVIRVAGTTEDISDRKATEAALRSARAEADRANAAKNEFLSRMSHELRTPLNAVLGFAQLLEMDGLTESQADSVSYILRGGRHLLAMINDVLDIAGIEADRLDLSLEPVQLGPLLAEVITMIRPLAAAATVEITFDPSQAAAAAYVRADLRRLRQVLINLLSNAIKYNRADGWIVVGCAFSGDSDVRITVADGGVGIREEDMPRLFTPFDRLGQQATTIEGAGIGLALSQRLVSFMAGRLEAKSVRGRGSVFSVTMPRADPSGPGALTGPHATDEPTVASLGGTLLYIEDNHSNVRLIQRILDRRPGWTLLHVDRGSEAVTLAADLDPAMIMLDLHLPDMNGIDVLHSLRQAPSTADVPIVVASADASPGQIVRLKAAGASAYVTKPLDVAEILSLLDAYARVRPAL